MQVKNGYHRRSRHGCGTCREARIKCDELRPSCLQCQRRGTNCAGYAQQLKWKAPHVAEPLPRVGPFVSYQRPPSHPHGRSPPSQAGHHAESSILASLSPSLGLSLRSNGLALQTPLDERIFCHWLRVMPQLLYPNPEKYYAINQQYLGMLSSNDSILLPSILASGAGHMAIGGLLPDVQFLERRQIALKTMVRTVRYQVKERSLSRPTTVPDGTIVGSMHMIGLEVMLGGAAGSIIALLQGLKYQLDCKWIHLDSHAQPSRTSSSDARNEVLVAGIKMMTYFDFICCVPCARPPILDQRVWDTYVVPNDNTHILHAKAEPDMVFGFCSKVLPLIGKAAVLVDGFFSNSLDVDCFTPSRDDLLESLQQCCEDLPPLTRLVEQREGIYASTEYENARDRNACISAAFAHSLATQIFLRRAYEDHPSLQQDTVNDSSIQAVVKGLSDLVHQVSLDTSSATMMLWPMFVLGCESRPGTDLRCHVTERFEKMFAYQKLLNIQGAFLALRDYIWQRTPDIMHDSDEAPMSWVRYCWQARIELCLA